MPGNVSGSRVPSYRRHKPSGQAVVTMGGHNFYLGKWNTNASRAEYDRLIREWLADRRCLPVSVACRWAWPSPAPMCMIRSSSLPLWAAFPSAALAPPRVGRNTSVAIKDSTQTPSVATRGDAVTGRTSNPEAKSRRRSERALDALDVGWSSGLPPGSIAFGASLSDGRRKR